MTRERNQRKQDARAAQQAANERTRRRNAWLLRGAAAIAVIVAVVVGTRSYGTRQLLKDVKTTTYAGGQHVTGPVDYRETPPTGGPHNVVWQNCAVYDTPIHNEHGVHALEHGAVWITYRPDLPKAQVETLKKLAADDYMLVSPYPHLGSPVVASAWNHQLALTGADDRRLTAFIKEYKNNPSTTPEFGAPCAGGTSASAAEDTLSARPTAPTAPAGFGG